MQIQMRPGARGLDMQRVCQRAAAQARFMLELRGGTNAEQLWQRRAGREITPNLRRNRPDPCHRKTTVWIDSSSLARETWPLAACERACDCGATLRRGAKGDSERAPPACGRAPWRGRRASGRSHVKRTGYEKTTCGKPANRNDISFLPGCRRPRATKPRVGQLENI